MALSRLRYFILLNTTVPTVPTVPNIDDEYKYSSTETRRVLAQVSILSKA
jgi:hypothetical protein